MKLTIAWIISVFVMGMAASHADEGQVFDGAPVLSRVVELHFHGNPMDVRLIVASLHLMGHQALQPIGLLEYFYILPDSQSGNASRCERWFKQVLLDQEAQSASSETRSWLEIVRSVPSALLETDEGIFVIPGGQIRCWEAVEFKAPNP